MAALADGAVRTWEQLGLEPVDSCAIAERLGVDIRTVHQWRKRTRQGLLNMPGPRWIFGGDVPVWVWMDVLEWAGDNGRIATEAVAEQFRRLCGREPAERARAGRPPAP